MLTPVFAAHIVVHHRRRVPSPILPISYTYFLIVALPKGIASLSLPEQLSAAKTATIRRRLYPFPGPFGPIVAFELRCTHTVSVYLDSMGDFA